MRAGVILMTFYESFGVTGGFYIHDPSAVAYVMDPTLFETEPARVRVDADGLGLGQTITAFGLVPDFWESWSGAPEIQVCVGVDGPRFLELYEATVSN